MFWLEKIESTQSDAIIIHVEKEKLTINGEVFNLANLKRRKDFSAFSRYAFPLKNGLRDELSRTIKDEHGGQHFFPVAMTAFEMFAYTHNSKLDTAGVGRFLYASVNVQIIFYPETKDFTDALLYVIAPADPSTPFKITTVDDKGKIIDYAPDKTFNVHHDLSYFPEMLPKCTLEAVDKKDNITTFEFKYKTMDDKFVEVDFKAPVKTDKGYVSHSKIEVVKGVGRFKFVPLGLDAGETAHIQVGIGKHTEVASYNIKV